MLAIELENSRQSLLLKTAPVGLKISGSDEIELEMWANR